MSLRLFRISVDQVLSHENTHKHMPHTLISLIIIILSTLVDQYYYRGSTTFSIKQCRDELCYTTGANELQLNSPIGGNGQVYMADIAGSMQSIVMATRYTGSSLDQISNSLESIGAFDFGATVGAVNTSLPARSSNVTAFVNCATAAPTPLVCCCCCCCYCCCCCCCRCCRRLIDRRLFCAVTSTTTNNMPSFL
jgi:hypothetical protein